MNATGTITMTMREVDRLKVIEAVAECRLKPGQAAERLDLSVRQKGAAGAGIDPRALRRFWADAGSETAGKGVTQFGRALYELNVDAFCANSSQAKGRVERADLTVQDRLVKELRLRGISTREAADAYAPSFIADFNRRFGKPPKRGRESGACRHRGDQS